MNIHTQLAQFFDGIEHQKRDKLNNLPTTGYTSTEELFRACSTWIDLENGAFYSNGYKEYFENIIANLKHENSQNLALALCIKLNNFSKVQLFLLLRLLTRTATDTNKWNSRMEAYLDRGKVIFTTEELETLFIGLEKQDICTLANILQYNRRIICLTRPLVYARQFLGTLPEACV